MLNDTKSKFKYVPACATDIRKTFARLKRAQKAQQQTPTPPPEPSLADVTHVVPMRKRGAR